ncbi:hypothetical protein T07_9181 [Trichinella nelsoni]|uniref:Uncharacterized protein n=1 Tax=Trichinella nelsoni TaxID=6336 RepID=A0A0V0RKC0_9BILA|nr:hypothetical protein T07_9181 [Trichinella nelsoni]
MKDRKILQERCGLTVPTNANVSNEKLKKVVLLKKLMKIRIKASNRLICNFTSDAYTIWH